jgi:hypothetical protein
MSITEAGTAGRNVFLVDNFLSSPSENQNVK